MDVRIDGKTVWLTQQQMAQLYGKAKSTISEHITHIFEEGELDPKVVVREFRTTTQHGAMEGKTQINVTRFYNLSMIIAIGGLTTFRGPHPTKAEVVVAKNYLDEKELRKLNNMVSGFFDFAENRALDHIPTTMHDYRTMLDRILSAGGYPLLEGAGSVSAEEAREKALNEYHKFRLRTLSPVEQAYIAQLEKEAKNIRKR